MAAQTSFLDHYTILRKLGEGTFAKVKLGQDNSTGELVALKILKSTCEGVRAVAVAQTLTEIQVLSRLSHPNILRLIGYNQQGLYTSKKKGTFTRLYVTTELAPYGDLFDVLCYAQQLSEPLIRTMFKQLISAVYTAHKAGISHRDIKPENVLLNERFHICLADFGWAGALLGRDNSGYMRTKAGTESYMAPEVLQGLQYRGTAIDVFSCGVLLFIMATKLPPFNKADVRDQKYVCFVERNELFWETFAKRTPWIIGDFKGLLNGMLHPDPTRRFRIEEIWVHPWLAQPDLDPAAFASEMQTAYTQSQQRHTQVPKRRVVDNGGNEYRAGLGDSRESSDALLPKQPIGCGKSTVLYTGMSADLCMRTVEAILRSLKAQVRVVEGKFKLKAQFTEDGEDTGEPLWGLEVSVELFESESGIIAAEVNKQRGDRYGLQSLFSLLEHELEAAAVS